MYLCKPDPSGGKDPQYSVITSPLVKSFPGMLPTSQCKISKFISGRPRRCNGSTKIVLSESRY